MQRPYSFVIGLLVIIAIVLAGFGLYSVYKSKRTVSEEPKPLSSPVAQFPTTKVSPPPQQPESGTNTANVQLGITVNEPRSNQLVSSPVKIKGTANVPEGEVTIQVKDSAGQILGEAIATACFDLNPCFFEASVVFDRPQTAFGTVEVYSQKDQIPPVIFPISVK